jgi:hypothetical protein
MVETNLLLAATLAIVRNFGGVVDLPPEDLPSTVATIEHYSIGSPRSPMDVCITHRGNIFMVSEGAVEMFECSRSLAHLQNPEQLPAFFGPSRLSANQILFLASNKVQTLERSGNLIASVVPVIKKLPDVGTNTVSFYQILWPKPEHTSGFDCFAEVEVDARTGRVASLELHDPMFRDYTVATQISKVAYRAAGHIPAPMHPQQVGTRSKSLFPLPTTNQVQTAIQSWLWLCHELELATGTETDISTVNWTRTCIYTNMAIVSATDAVCRVEFSNGTWFLSLGGVAISHHPSDSYFSASASITATRNVAFRGPVKYRWQDLAARLQGVLVAHMAPAVERLKSCSVHRISTSAADPGIEGIKRILIGWSRHIDGSEALGAEFDLETGELKDVAFNDALLITELRAAQAESRRQ